MNETNSFMSLRNQHLVFQSQVLDITAMHHKSSLAASEKMQYFKGQKLESFNILLVWW